jgi:hypothetical protein
MFAEGSDDEDVSQMKWAAIGLGASLLALAVGALALTTRGGGQSTRIATTTVGSAPLGVQIPVAPAQPSQPVSSATKQARSGANLSRPCQGKVGDESDPTGDDRSNARDCTNSSGDNQAGDNAGGNQP